MNYKLLVGTEEYIVEFSEGQTILEAAKNAGISGLNAACGGNGTCGKCRVKIIAGETEKSELACLEKAVHGITVIAENKDGTVVAKRGINRAAVVKEPEGEAGSMGYGIACDIGTTTVALMLADLASGKVLKTVGKANSQSSYGADVISRIVSANEGNLEVLKTVINKQIAEMINDICEKTGVDTCEIRKMTVAANPTMSHLFTGLSPESIGVAPFIPVSYFGDEHDSSEFGFPFDGKVYILPSVSGYVGGDITADMIACDTVRSEKKMLVVDVGTNGEMFVGDKNEIICCSTAAGPAFEGAQITRGMTAAPGAINSVEIVGGELVIKTVGNEKAKGICGSGLIDAVAVMLELGALDETGRILDIDEDEDDIPDEAKPYLFLDDNYDPCFRLTDEVCITQSDIRKLQLGKGAISAGLHILMLESGAKYEDINELLLAGGFGSYIRPESAARIGLIPEELLEVTRPAGNTAIEGALDALLADAYKEELSRLRESVKYFELSGKAAFTELYVENMMFD